MILTKMWTEFKAKFIEVDIYFNYYWFNGNKGETISSRLGRRIKYYNCYPCKLFCRGILWVLGPFANNKNWFRHCKESIQKEYIAKENR